MRRERKRARKNRESEILKERLREKVSNHAEKGQRETRLEKFYSG